MEKKKIIIRDTVKKEREKKTKEIDVGDRVEREVVKR